MSEDAKSFEDRYRSAKFVDFWMSDERMEAARTFWRQKLISFLPFELTDGVHVLDLGAGTGKLSLEILKKYPNAYVTCHDFSEVMLSHARKQLADFESRTTFVQSDLRNTGWSQPIKGPFDAVVSSFVTHTLPERVKAIYQELFALISPGGLFLSCDSVSPSGPDLQQIVRRSQLIEYQDRIKARTGVERSLQEIEQRLRERRSRYHAFFEGRDEMSSLSTLTLANHMQWLTDAGFDEVDCLWRQTRTAVIASVRHRAHG